MMRLPQFRYHAPRTLREAAAILRKEGPQAMIVAGGTDLYPNMKRRHQTPKTVISLRAVGGLRGMKSRADGGLSLGPLMTLTDLEESAAIRKRYPGLHEAIRTISTPVLRNMGTIGGNICLDTRCNYYNQNYEWRRAIDFCMKCDGEICWVAPGSDTCLAVSSSDTAPVLCAMDARLRLMSERGRRTVLAREFFRRDGIAYLTKRNDEILTAIDLPSPRGWRSAYRKLRRREAFDFPVLGVAVQARFNRKIAADVRIWLGAVASAPVEATEAQDALLGRLFTDEAIDEAARLAWPRSKPVDNTDFVVRWRKDMTRILTRDALRALRSSR
jgi:4-hydroxybenzoyl-CoA reductase subunit beta